MFHRPNEGSSISMFTPKRIHSVLITITLAAVTFMLGTKPAIADPIPIANVTAELTGIPIPIGVIGVSSTFKVSVAAANADPKCCLSDFTVQARSAILGIDIATIPGFWRSAPGWRLVSQDNVNGNAHFEALSFSTCIKPGAFLDGFGVAVVGLQPFNLVVTEISTTCVPEPTTMLLLSTGLAGVAINARKRFKTRKRAQGSQ